MEVRTKEELKQAQQEGAEEIIVTGKLAKQLYAARKVKTLSKASLGIITSALGIGALAAVPTGGLSLGISGLAAAPIAAATGISAEALLLISAVGVTFIITLIQGYDNWEYDFKRQKLKLSKSRR